MADEAPDQTTMAGEGNQPEGTGYAPPDTGQGEVSETEIPVGVDQIDAKPPEEGDDGGSAPLDLANLDTGDADADADAGATAEADADAGDADADAGDADADAGDADAEADAGDAAEAEGEAGGDDPS